jgi:Flp pilus assembly protein TadG
MKLSRKQNFRKDKSGVAALEFAILLPFLLIVLYGTYTVAVSILISRKVDNSVNDLGFIISREPRIATGNVNIDIATGNVKGCKTEGCSGGATRLNSIIDNLMPILLYPNTANTKYAAMISYVGVPVTPSGAPNTMRIMWSHQRGAQGAANSNVSAQIGLESICAPYQSTTTVNNTPGVVTSTYKEKYLADTQAIERATVVFPGQSFIVSTIRFQSDGFGTPTPKNGNIPSGRSLFDSSNFLRHSTYAVRSSWQDVNGNGRVDSSEFFNEMHYCTDCSFKTSRDINEPISAIGNQNTSCSSDAAKLLQMRCVTDPSTLVPPNGNTSGSSNYYSSGCVFK